MKNFCWMTKLSDISLAAATKKVLSIDYPSVRERKIQNKSLCAEFFREISTPPYCPVKVWSLFLKSTLQNDSFLSLWRYSCYPHEVHPDLVSQTESPITAPAALPPEPALPWDSRAQGTHIISQGLSMRLEESCTPASRLWSTYFPTYHHYSLYRYRHCLFYLVKKTTTRTNSLPKAIAFQENWDNQPRLWRCSVELNHVILPRKLPSRCNIIRLEQLSPTPGRLIYCDWRTAVWEWMGTLTEAEGLINLIYTLNWCTAPILVCQTPTKYHKEDGLSFLIITIGSDAFLKDR